PLYRQRVEIIRIERGADPDLIVRGPDGRHAAVAMSLTDYAEGPGDGCDPAVSSLLDLGGLRQLAKWIDPCRPERGYAASSPFEEPSR
ncbi:MAG: hypothetical protein ABTR27_01975, partial [Candidatus Competibacter phosphatis]